MNNSDAEQLLKECKYELQQVLNLLTGLGPQSNISPYLSKYALIKACGTVEYCFKTIIADHCSRRCKKQIKRFIDRRIRDGSANPSYSNICRFLEDFDGGWNTNFKTAVGAHNRGSALNDSLQSLVDLRNEFAHGGSPVVSIGDVIKYYDDAITVLETLDSVLVT